MAVAAWPAGGPTGCPATAGTTPPTGRAARLHGNAGNAPVYGGPGWDFITGNRGDDTLFGGPGVDGVYGGPGNDKVYGDSPTSASRRRQGRGRVRGSWANRLHGGDGNDLVVGTQLADLMSG